MFSIDFLLCRTFFFWALIVQVAVLLLSALLLYAKEHFTLFDMDRPRPLAYWTARCLGVLTHYLCWITTAVLLLATWHAWFIEAASPLTPDIVPGEYKALGAIISALLTLYESIVRDRLASPFGAKYAAIDKEYLNRQYLTPRLYIAEALRTIEEIAGNTANAIHTGDVVDAPDDWHAGQNKKRMFSKFLVTHRKATHHLLSIDNKADFDEQLFESLFVTLAGETCLPLLGDASELLRKSTVIPLFFSTMLQQAAENYKNRTAIKATSLLPFPRFCGMRGNFVRAASPVTSTRLFICSEADVAAQLVAEISKGYAPVISQMGLPMGLGQVFHQQSPIPFALWVWEWHVTHGWKMLLIDKTKAEEIFAAAHLEISEMDFLIVEVKDKYDVVVRAQIQSEENKLYGGLELPACPAKGHYEDKSSGRPTYECFRVLESNAQQARAFFKKHLTAASFAGNPLKDIGGTPFQTVDAMLCAFDAYKREEKGGPHT